MPGERTFCHKEIGDVVYKEDRKKPALIVVGVFPDQVHSKALRSGGIDQNGAKS